MRYKFKLWDKVEKEWQIIRSIGLDEDGSIFYIQCWDENEMDIDPPYLMDNLGVDFELVQYTGLTDTNGVEIYEGYIVDFGGVYVVKLGEHGVPSIESEEYIDLANGFYLKAEHDLKDVEPFGFDIPLNRNYAKKCEVIGNIYQNKELLKENE